MARGSFFRGMGGMLGYSIGACLLLPLFLWVKNIYNKKHDVLPFKDKYLSEMFDVKIDFPYKEYVIGQNSYERESFTSHYATKNMGRSSSVRMYLYSQIFYDSNLKKYFRLNLIDNGNSLPRDVFSVLNGKEAYFIVNRDELTNPKLGTKDHPIFTFGAKGVDKPLVYSNSSNQEYVVDCTPEIVEFNFGMYFTFLATDEEFEARFGKEK